MKTGEQGFDDSDGPTDEAEIYKEYKYPDGRVLRLTKEEFLRVVDVFRLLLKHDEKMRKDGRLPSLPKSDSDSGPVK